MTKRIALALVFLSSACATGDVKPNSLFADHAVLQRDAAVPVWGTAAAGERVGVRVGEQDESTVAGSDGKWIVKLKPMPAGGPFTMTISGKNAVTLRDILVGDVWVCSGQSNMERQLGPRPPQPEITGWREEAASANYPKVRQFYVPLKAAAEPVGDAGGTWSVCSPDTAKDFSAVGYFFARDVHKQTGIPVGMLFTAWGGTPARAWTSLDGLKPLPEYTARMTALEAARKAGPPPATNRSGNPNEPTVLYNAMLAPLQPFPIKGVIWYQGESDNSNARGYRDLFPAMIADWRRGWGAGDFPFLFVQIAPHKSMSPDIREAQMMTLAKCPNTAMVVTTDVGNANDIHPADKGPVGARLALAARALAYGETIEYSGPLFDTLRVDGDRAIVTFTHVGAGLTAKGGDLRGFEIAGADGQFVPARAEIEGKAVVVRSDSVSKPSAVRYGWANVPEVNLFNNEGLPASPFRTSPN